jgi:hypothetical protein
MSDAKTIQMKVLECVVSAKPDKSLVAKLNPILEARGFRLALYWKHGVLSVGDLPPSPQRKVKHD